MNAAQAVSHAYDIQELPVYSSHEVSGFSLLQELILDFRNQLLIPCESDDELASLLDAANEVLMPLRERILLLVRNQSMSCDVLDELIRLYNSVWDRTMKLEREGGMVRVVARDIYLEEDNVPATMF